MQRTLIIARITPGSQHHVADIFARSDASSMPHEIGVSQRALYAFRGLYAHVIDFDRDPAEAMSVAQSLPAFRAISDDLRGHITAYDPTTWTSPRDAMAECFYSWSAVATADRR